MEVLAVVLVLHPARRCVQGGSAGDDGREDKEKDGSSGQQ